jgi:hypothetical protein
VLVFIFAAKFSKRQNWLKCLSVIKSEGYARLMLEALDDNSIRQGLRELAAEVDKIDKRRQSENRMIWRKKGKPGSWVMPLLWLFFLAQLVAIACYRGRILF